MSSEHLYHLECGDDFIESFVKEVNSLSPYPPERIDIYWMGVPGDVRVILRLSPHESMQSDYLLGLASGYSAACKIGWDKYVTQYRGWYVDYMDRWNTAVGRVQELEDKVMDLKELIAHLEEANDD